MDKEKLLALDLRPVHHLHPVYKIPELNFQLIGASKTCWQKPMNVKTQESRVKLRLFQFRQRYWDTAHLR